MKKTSTKNQTQKASTLLVILLLILALSIDQSFRVFSKDHELIFISPTVVCTDKLISSLPHSAEIIYLDRKISGLDQITKYLLRKEDIDRIRIISHGNEGYIALNGELIDEEFLACNSSMLSSWKDALTEDADIMLYGCKVAANEGGRALVKKLAELTGADVAAATREIGGTLANWSLDYKIGEIETLALKIEGYEFHLENQIVTNNNNDGSGSLRQAIADVGSGEEITFNLTAGVETITLATELTIAKDINIDGNNAAGSGSDVIVDGDNTCRVFNISRDAVTLTVSISNITIQNGNTSGDGGGILNQNTLILSNATISGNTANYGGGIFCESESSNTSISNCTISENTASYGGGIALPTRGIKLLLNTEIANNAATNSGGGLYIGNGSIQEIKGCIFSENSAVKGGGISTNNFIGKITGTTISDNSASGNGGGIHNSRGRIDGINGCTISENSAVNGGGVYIYDGKFEVKNTIISGNTANGSPGDFHLFEYNSARLTDNGNNIVGYSNKAATDSDGFGHVDDILFNTLHGSGSTSETSWSKGGTELTNQNMNLAANLADNGGPTETLAITSGSFAIEAGIASAENNMDQRGFDRNTLPTIGAFEFFPAGIWTGALSSNWASPENWDINNAPLNGNNVTIPNGATNDPVINSSVGASARNLTVNIGAKLTLESGGSLITLGDINNNGTIEMKRAISENAWHLISIPVAGQTANHFLTSFLQSWNESTGLWTEITEPTTALSTKTGYALWANSGKTQEFTFSGTPLTGMQSIGISANGSGGSFNGANLLGNPYPSSIDWGQVSGYGAVYYWDGSAYVAYPEGTGTYGTGSRYIPPMQGFFIVAEGNGTFDLTNAIRTHEGAGSFYKNGNTPRLNDGLMLTASNGNYEDKLLIRLNENAAAGFEKPKDAWKLPSNTPGLSQLWSACNDGNLSIDVRPQQETIQLGFANDVAGIYSISIKEIADIPKAFLEDTKTGISHNLQSGAYEFTWNPEMDLESRFKLHFKAVGIEENQISESDIRIYTADGQIFIKGAENGNMMVSDMMGRTVLQQTISGSELTAIPVNLKTGVYVVMVYSDSGACSTALYKTEKVFIK